MASLKDIRKRIGTVRNTQQITKAMKMVAAAKLRRAQAAVESARPYVGKLDELLRNLAARLPGDADVHPFLGEGGSAPPDVILITSDRGLCGAYNASLIKTAEAFLASDTGRDATVTAWGRRGHDYLVKRLGERLTIVDPENPLEFDHGTARTITADVSRRFLDGEVGAVYLVYSTFKSAISQTPVVEQLLPIRSSDDDAEAEQVDYLSEPSGPALLESLAGHYIGAKVFQAMLEGLASEHGARMTAMDNATRNASEMLDRLTLEMNRARQAGITTELMEIVGGAEALNG